MKPTLVILAAGMASRYGSMKQIDGFGPSGETIMEYSIYDAIRAGFGKVVFIIKKDFLDNFKSIFDKKLAGKIDVEYVFQDLDLKPYGITEEIYREKPWGTSHAMLAARDAVQGPFCVINADDYYGYDAFKQMADFLNHEVDDAHYALMGYEIGNTLSDNGSVSRGVCEVKDNMMTGINERTKIERKGEHIVYTDESGEYPLAPDARVSMNFWGFTPAVFNVAKEDFVRFAEANKQNPKAEYFIPLTADYLIQNDIAEFKVIPTSSKWFGVTYKEDKPVVQQGINELIENGTYPANLWG